VKIPSNVSRWMHLPETNSFVPLEDVVADNLVELFPGTEILEVQSFRITRNADVDRNEEEAEDLLDMIEEELRHRRFNDIVRVEISESMSESLRSWLKTSLGVGDEDLYAVKGPLALRDLLDLDGEVDLPGIRFEPHTGVTHPRLRPLDEDDCDQTIFDVIRAGDFLVHHPYQSFSSSVLRFLESAASDPKVLAIKGTLYRTAKNSPIIKALVKAAENGKQVVVMVEIRARFDEANNIEWVHVWENVGAHVAYGVVGLKTHTKTFAVLRQDEDGLRQYCHIGTGNYHTGTAKLYTDVGLFTCDPGFGNDLVHLFNFITGHSRFRNYQHLLIGPLNMRRRFVEMIRREATKHTPERPGRIIAKMNQLEDKDIMMELYRASQAGVQIDLIIRGFCCLRAGVPGLSDNIRVMSTIGRFLEHSRIFYFHNGGDDEIYIGSADWMYRNLDRRVEAAAPVRHPALKQSLKDILDAHLKDQRQTWDLHADGKYVQRKPVEIDEGVGVQERLITTPACS
jgi:polyphosphate kinase